MPNQPKGMQELLALFGTLPKAADAEIREEIPKVGAQVLAAQKEAVPVRTGDLWRGLTTQVLDGGRKVRVGLVGKGDAASSKRLNLYYGRFVEFGRRGQTVAVQRRRRVGGRLRTLNRRKRAQDIVATYAMKVSPMPPRPFVYGPAALAAELDAAEDLASFWDKVLAREAANA